MDLLPRIEIDGASKTIGNSVVLDQIQLTVKPGEMIGLQGVNGSGKTMLLRLISLFSFSFPSSDSSCQF